jgi:hypothetical protein
MTILSYYNFGKYLQRIKKDNGIFSNMKRDKFMKRLNSWRESYFDRKSLIKTEYKYRI